MTKKKAKHYSTMLQRYIKYNVYFSSSIIYHPVWSYYPYLYFLNVMHCFSAVLHISSPFVCVVICQVKSKYNFYVLKTECSIHRSE